MRHAVLVLALAAGGDALLGPSLSARAGAPPAVRQLAHVVLRPPIRESHTAVQMMAVRTENQRAAFSGAKDTMDLKTAVSRVAKAKATRVVAAVAAVLCAVIVAPGGVKAWVKALVGPKVPVVKALALKAFLSVWNLFVGPAAQSLGLRVLTRLIDYGVPAAVVVFAIVMAGGDDDKAEDMPEENPLKKLFKGSSKKSGVGAPAKEYIRIESLGDKLSSMEYTIAASTTSKADAARAQRRRNLARRFGDDLGDIGDTALAGVAAAEASWRKKAAAPAEAAAAARADIRSISVKLGGESAPRSAVGGDRDEDASGLDKQLARDTERKQLEKKRGRAEKALAAAQKHSLELEASFLMVASEALGDGTSAWEKRAALAKLVAAPVSWDPTDVPLPRNPGLASGKRAFVLNFEGDTAPAQTASLREEVTAIVRSADAARGDTVILRLVSGGGSVTGYGLAMAQLLRLKEAGLHLTVCVEQVAASGGYMMACVADKIVASPFAVLGSIGVITQIPNVYERLNKEGVVYQTVTAGEFKRTLTPFKKIDPKDVEKTEQEIGEIFALFKGFVGKQRPQLDIDKIATGETWFGEDAIERNLADALQTYDDLLLELHSAGVDIYSVEYKMPAESTLAKLGIGSAAAAAPATGNWLTRVVAAAIGVPLGQPQSPYSYTGDHIRLG